MAIRRSRGPPEEGSRYLRVLDYCRIVLAIFATIAAVAGGQLAVSMTPAHPRVGQRVDVAMTGQVGDKGRLFVYRNSSRRCGASVSDERRIGTRVANWYVPRPFEHHVVFRPKRAHTEWVCAYLYAISCDATGQQCGAPTGLPPDAGFAQVRVRVRPASH